MPLKKLTLHLSGRLLWNKLSRFEITCLRKYSCCFVSKLMSEFSKRPQLILSKNGFNEGSHSKLILEVKICCSLTRKLVLVIPFEYLTYYDFSKYFFWVHNSVIFYFWEIFSILLGKKTKLLYLKKKISWYIGRAINGITKTIVLGL